MVNFGANQAVNWSKSNIMTSKTLVLGASGFLGNHFVQPESQEIYQFRTKPESIVPHHLILDPWNTDELEKLSCLGQVITLTTRPQFGVYFFHLKT